MVVTRSMTTAFIDEIVVNQICLYDMLLKNELPSKHYQIFIDTSY